MGGSENIPAVRSLCCLLPYGSVQGWVAAHAGWKCVCCRTHSVPQAVFGLDCNQAHSKSLWVLCVSAVLWQLHYLHAVLFWHHLGAGFRAGSCPSWPFAQATSPPTHQERESRNATPAGAQSAEALKAKIAAHPVRCEVRTRDQYQRSVSSCSVLTPQGPEDIGDYMVSNGYAVAYR